MPFSQSSQLSTIVGFIEELAPKSVLDVGTGMGQYGFLARNNLEFLNLFSVNGAAARQTSKDEWKVRIDGIEGCEIYLTPVHQYAYNQVMIGNAMDLLPKIESRQYEYVMAIDILEHFETPEGLIFLDQLKRVASRAVLISTPKEFHAQEVEANPYENHRSVWTQAQLTDAGFAEILPNEESWIAIARV